MLFTEVHNPIIDTKFLINVKQITSICLDECSVWMADGGGYLTLDDVSINKILNILKTEGAIIDN